MLTPTLQGSPDLGLFSIHCLETLCSWQYAVEAGPMQMGFVTKIPEGLSWQMEQGNARIIRGRSGLWIARG